MTTKSTFALMIIMLSALFTFNAHAADVDGLNPIDKLKVTSALFEGTLEFNVTLPIDYDNDPDRRYSLYLDFHERRQPMLTGLQDWMSHNGEAPWLKTLIVTPSNSEMQIRKLFSAMNKDSKNTAMQDFLEKDLLPAIDKKYRTNGFRILTDFRSTIALHTLFTRPNLFNAYVTVSPALANNDNQLLKMAKKRLSGLSDKHRFLYASTGDSHFERNDLAAFETFDQLVKSSAPKQLKWQVKRFLGMEFMSQSPLATIYAIEWIFRDINTVLTPDSAIAKQGAQAVLKHYKKLSEDVYGFEVSAEESLMELGLSQLKTNPNEALKTLHLAIEHAPKSPHGFNALASVYAEQKQWDKAVKYQTVASQIAKHPFWKDRFGKTLVEYQKMQ